MNWDQIEGKWQQMKGQVQQRWGKLTDDDFKVIQGKKNQMVGKLKERYGYSAEQAEKEVCSFLDSCDCSAPNTKQSGSSNQTTY